MQTKQIHLYISLGIITCLLGMLLVLFQQEILIFRMPQHNKQHAIGITRAKKKQVTLYAWHNGSWQQDSFELIWPKEKQAQLTRVINSWFAYMHDEKLLPKKVTVQQVLLATGDQIAYVSCDRNPFGKAQPIHAKWHSIESMLKTVGSAGIPGVQELQILVNHKPLHDPHLDSARPWPIAGFMKQ